jgi:hypothetical protein
MAETFDTDGNIVRERRVVINQRRRGGEVVQFTAPYRIPEGLAFHDGQLTLPGVEPPPSWDSFAATPFAAFDPTKPTIDQTRKDAIDSIRSNFQNLPTVTPAGADKQVQFRDGAVFGGDAGLTYDKVTDTLTVAGAIGVPTLNAQTVNITPGNLTLSGGGAATIIGSTGAIAQAGGAAKLEVRSAAGGDAAYMTFHRPAVFAGYFGLDTDNQWKVGGYSYGAASYKILTEQNSFGLDANKGLWANGGIISTYLWLGGPSTFATVDFRQGQTLGMQAGSIITSINAYPGMVGRIWVNGNGAITLPATVHIPVGGATWGIFGTMVSLVSLDASGYFLATFVPYNA